MLRKRCSAPERFPPRFKVAGPPRDRMSTSHLCEERCGAGPLSRGQGLRWSSSPPPPPLGLKNQLSCTIWAACVSGRPFFCSRGARALCLREARARESVNLIKGRLRKTTSSYELERLRSYDDAIEGEAPDDSITVSLPRPISRAGAFFSRNGLETMFPRRTVCAAQNFLDSFVKRDGNDVHITGSEK